MKTQDIRTLLDNDQLVIGHDQTVKTLREGGASKVLIAANAPLAEAASMRSYAEISNVEVVDLEADNQQLGTICRKPFPIAFIAVKQA